ncbi:hypothetical protein ACJJH9_00160 (plasmid) [Microbulbifer sp. DLAB2-AF]|uniref:hypothetical protein n=1 Tax=Microbulbifer sp. DLAB2-AF TaxID=3243395 RepID=UPI00403A7991
MIDIHTPASRGYFTDVEMRCGCAVCNHARSQGERAPGCASNMRLDFMAHLNRVRERVYCRPMPIASGFRCEHHPEESFKRRRAEQAGTWIPGDHPSGVGVDVRVQGSDAHALMRALHVYNWFHIQNNLPQPFTAICPHQRGRKQGRFIHIGGNTDAPGRPRPWLWTY